jgi:hypothetical protein
MLAGYAPELEHSAHLQEAGYDRGHPTCTAAFCADARTSVPYGVSGADRGVEIAVKATAREDRRRP